MQKACAIFFGRRSGAQRGALEINLGQRFSWAPLAISGINIIDRLKFSSELILAEVAPPKPQYLSISDSRLDYAIRQNSYRATHDGPRT
jgi:hypothetical protein